MPDILNINTANSLSVFFSPGQDFRTPTTSSESIFTFGDYQIQRAPTTDNVAPTNMSAMTFSSFSSLADFTGTTLNLPSSYGTQDNELNPDVRNPNSYSYFGSFYTQVSTAINSVIQSFPYAILVLGGTGPSSSIRNYVYDEISQTSTFYIPVTNNYIINQGNVIISSGISTDTSVSNLNNLYNNFQTYGIQFSGSGDTNIYNIIGLSRPSGALSAFTEITINGQLPLLSAATVYHGPIYIRPTADNYSNYQRTISNLEYQVAFDGTFKVPDTDDNSLFSYVTYTWPKTIDGFNIDTYGSDFDIFTTAILNAASRIDDSTTNWMIRTMIPEQFIELDTDTQIYQSLISVYATEFDKIKGYIDSLSFMHTVTYDRLESVPDKLMYRLSRLLSFDYHDAFNASDMFEYLLTEDNDGKTLQDYNFDIWRKILINITWLYKKKGTRDAIMFLFKIMGAPDELITFNEFVYKITPVNYLNPDPNNLDPKISSDGYPNLDTSPFAFQEGGLGRGNGVNYVDQWAPEFQLDKTIDNTKIYTGDTTLGTRNILNSKEVQISLDPAGAIEKDVKAWYELGYGLWNFGSSGFTFSGLTVPFEWAIDAPFIDIAPPNMTAMTVNQWMDYLYMSNVDPTNRKTIKNYDCSTYMSLKKVYMTYMLWASPGQLSNQLTFQKLEGILELLERNFFKYMKDFVPATSILELNAAVYRNTVFERQKYVYPEGINVGSEFQVAVPDDLIEVINPYAISSTVNPNIAPNMYPYALNTTVVENISPVINPFNMSSIIAPLINPSNAGFGMGGTVNITTTNSQQPPTPVSGQTTTYSSGNTVYLFTGSTGTYTGLPIVIQNQITFGS